MKIVSSLVYRETRVVAFFMYGTLFSAQLATTNFPHGSCYVCTEEGSQTLTTLNVSCYNLGTVKDCITEK